METDNPLAVGYTGLEDAQIEDALRFIKEYKGDRPLCIYLALMLPHPHYAATEADYRAIDADKIEIPVRLDEKQRKNKASILEGIRKNHRLYEWKDEEPVSYTHLFIDKNIKEGIKLKRINVCICINKGTKGEHDEENKVWKMVGMFAISYKHLDVYKRQEYCRRNYTDYRK